MLKRSKATTVKRVRQNTAKASDQLLTYLKTSFTDEIPMNYVTAVSKKYAKQRCLHEEDKFVQRFVENKGYVSTNKLVDYLKTTPSFTKGQGLTDESVRRVYNSCSNPQGKLTYEYLMRMGEEVGVPISQKEAKDMVKRYGKRKQFMSVEDCLKLNERKRKRATSLSKTPKKGK